MLFRYTLHLYIDFSGDLNHVNPSTSSFNQIFTTVVLFRSNFALFLLSEMVIDIGDVEWAVHLPLLLHVITLGKVV